MKIVYNGCYGGFDLSDKAIRRYAELKGITLYNKTKTSLLDAYYTQPDFADGSYFSTQDIARTDLILVQVIEELGAEANGTFADLHIEDVSAGQRWRIAEYDGSESVMTIDDYEWHIAE